MNEILIVIFSGVVAVSTVLYVIFTRRLALESHRMRQVQTEPRVSVDLELSSNLTPGIELVIRNEGQGSARNLTFEFEGDPTYFQKSVRSGSHLNVNQIPVIKEGLDYMASGKVLRFLQGTMTQEVYERASKRPWIFHVQYENLSGKVKKDSFTLDFYKFDGMYFDLNHLEEISKHLHSIQKDIHRLTEGHAKVKVVTQTKDEFLKEREERVFNQTNE